MNAYIVTDTSASEDVAEESKDDSATKYLPMKLNGQRVLHRINSGTYRVVIPQSFWHLVGIAYRKSMILDDRDDCGVDHGQIVRGKAQMNGWLAVKFNKSDCKVNRSDCESKCPISKQVSEWPAVQQVGAETAIFKPNASLPSRGMGPSKRPTWKPVVVLGNGVSQLLTLDAEVSESEFSLPPKSDSHTSETVCPSDDDSERFSQVQTGRDRGQTVGSAFTSDKQLRISWADVETDDEDEF